MKLFDITPYTTYWLKHIICMYWYHHVFYVKLNTKHVEVLVLQTSFGDICHFCGSSCFDIKFGDSEHKIRFKQAIYFKSESEYQSVFWHLAVLLHPTSQHYVPQKMQSIVLVSYCFKASEVGPQRSRIFEYAISSFCYPFREIVNCVVRTACCQYSSFQLGLVEVRMESFGLYKL